MNRASDKWTGGSGMMAFYIKGDLNKAKKFCSSLKMIRLAFSLGDIQSLIDHPVTMTHKSVPEAQRKK